MGWLEGQSVIITGGGSGLGYALVQRFRAEGAQVAVLQRSAHKAEALRREFPDVLVVEGDVQSIEDNLAVVARTVDAYSKLDCFIANAGLWDFKQELRELPYEDLDRAFDEILGVNVKGVLAGARAAVEALERSQGSLIVSASNASFYPGGGGPLYTASKHAVIGVVRQLAYELAPDVRVNAVAPGYLPSDLRGPAALGQNDRTVREMYPTGEEAARRALLGREIHAEDYAGAYVLLASRHNSPTATGTVIDLSGVGVRGRRDRVPALTREGSA
ncbi:3-(cis-5,6-dihydroxycyclohexa-1,3-dien-1-yl)propanoate dehydrogenase [Nocardia sp. NPDC052112]|uniref:3-(cis-5,6-dihydroxycyclohexa-1, 3-dien-1-yl)propanoate dehydrogenase n=1 Tax=Nocardia sp. NPDC052112 TaxID=3155646 RepID=UPI0034206A80